MTNFLKFLSILFLGNFNEWGSNYFEVVQKQIVLSFVILWTLIALVYLIWYLLTRKEYGGLHEMIDLC